LSKRDWAQAAALVAAELYARQPEHQVRPRLEPTRRAVALMGDPQRNYRVIHITGTNGKTTTSRIIERLLREHGLRTGRMTSPHLISFNERIALDGEPISDELLVLAYEENAPLLDLIDAQLESEGEVRLTFFEALTALAFQIFSDAPVDVLVLEVGMGGEWDASNVADGEVAVFTPISLDHQKSLGDTVAEIAKTKSGIIKPESVVVSSPQTAEAAEVLRVKAGAQPFLAAPTSFGLIDTKPDGVGTRFSVRGQFAEYRDLWMPILGTYQAENAATAIAATEQFLGRAIDYEITRQALLDVVSPGRMQVISREPLEVLDGAHNAASANAFAQSAREYFDFETAVGVVGILNDKDAETMLRAFAQVFQTVVVTQPETPRALSTQQLAELCRPFFTQTEVSTGAFEGYRVAQRIAAEQNAALFVTGSLYTVGNLLRDLQQNLEQDADE
jgi:dihydrofolate synthase / folylpolyglutamate synthase